MNADQPFEEFQSDRDAAGIADDHILDAILRGKEDDTEEVSEARIARVMDRIASTRRETRSPKSPRTSWNRFPSASMGRALAACLLFGAVASMLIVLSQPRIAEATLLERAIQKMELEDQTYSITVITNQDTPPDEDRFEDRNLSRDRKTSADRQMRPRHPGSRAFAWRRGRDHAGRRSGGGVGMMNRLDGATLHTRGSRWTILVPGRKGEVFARGFDGVDSWTNHPADQSRMRGIDSRPGDDRGDRPIQLLEFAMLDVSEMIKEIDLRYDVSDPETVDSTALNATLVRYQATRTQPDQGSARSSDRDPGRERPGANRRHRLPESIEIWADPESEQIVFLRLTGLGLPNPGATMDVELALESTAPLRDDLFTRAGHPPFTPDHRTGERPPADRRLETDRENSRSGDGPHRAPEHSPDGV